MAENIKCDDCGAILTCPNGCRPKLHTCDEELEKAAKKAARTGNRTNLQEYLKLRRNYL